VRVCVCPHNICRTKQGAHRLKILFGLCELPAAAELHGDMTQAARLQSLEKFRKGEVAFLLATDVAARGLDILGLQASADGLVLTPPPNPNPTHPPQQNQPPPHTPPHLHPTLPSTPPPKHTQPPTQDVAARALDTLGLQASADGLVTLDCATPLTSCTP
jgi:hypothetical protein